MSTSPAETSDAAARLRSAGLRVTRPRLGVLTALQAHPHADAAEVLAAVRADLPSVSHQAVYDCLRALTKAELVRSIQPAGHNARYEIHTHDNHHHLVCRSCGQVADAACRTGSAPCMHAADDHGFRIDEAEVYYWGICSGCAVDDSPEAPTTPAQRGR